MSTTIIANLIIYEDGFSTSGQSKWTLAIAVAGGRHDILSVDIPIGRDEQDYAAQAIAKRLSKALKLAE